MSEEKRVRRTPEQIAADLDVQIEKLKDSILELENKKAASATEFDNKIAAVKEKIAKLEAKKKDVLTPKKRKPRKSKADQIKLLVRQAQKSGMKLDEIADKLGMALPEYPDIPLFLCPAAERLRDFLFSSSRISTQLLFLQKFVCPFHINHKLILLFRCKPFCKIILNAFIEVKRNFSL